MRRKQQSPSQTRPGLRQVATHMTHAVSNQEPRVCCGHLPSDSKSGRDKKKRPSEDSSNSTSIIDETPPPSKQPRIRVRFSDEETKTITEEFQLLTVESSNVCLARCRAALEKHPCLKDRSAKEVQDEVRSILSALKRRNRVI